MTSAHSTYSGCCSTGWPTLDGHFEQPGGGHAKQHWLSNVLTVWVVGLVVLSCCANRAEATPLPTMRQQEVDLERYLMNLAASNPSLLGNNNYMWPRHLETQGGTGGDWTDEDYWSAMPVKKNYQHIWRNVQMRMPHYRNTDEQVAESKRDMRHTANSLYRLGK